MKDDDLFDLFVMEEIEKESKRPNNRGSCITSLLLRVALTIFLIIGIAMVI